MKEETTTAIYFILLNSSIRFWTLEKYAHWNSNTCKIHIYIKPSAASMYNVYVHFDRHIVHICLISPTHTNRRRHALSRDCVLSCYYTFVVFRLESMPLLICSYVRVSFSIEYRTEWIAYSIFFLVLFFFISFYFSRPPLPSVFVIGTRFSTNERNAKKKKTYEMNSIPR